MLNYMALADGEATQRVKFELTEVSMERMSQARNIFCIYMYTNAGYPRIHRGCCNLAGPHRKRMMTESCLQSEWLLHGPRRGEVNCTS